MKLTVSHLFFTMPPYSFAISWKHLRQTYSIFYLIRMSSILHCSYYSHKIAPLTCSNGKYTDFTWRLLLIVFEVLQLSAAHLTLI